MNIICYNNNTMFSIPLTFNKTTFHPLFFITYACIMGIVWQYTYNHTIFALLALGIIVAPYYTHLYKKSLLIICMLAAFCLGAYRYYSIYTLHNQLIKQLATHPTTLQAIVADRIPVDHPLYKERLTFTLHQNINNAPLALYNQQLFVYTKACPTLEVDDTVLLHGIVIKKTSSSSYDNYLTKEGALASVFTSHLDYTLVQRPYYSPARWLHTMKNNALQSLAYKMDTEPYHLFASLFLGNKPVPKKILEHTKEHFNTWGVTHYLARSGLHMIIIAMVWHTLINCLPLSYAIRTVLLIALSILYGLLSWPTISFNRALMSFVVYKLCDLFYMPTHFLHTVTVVCLAVIIYNPLHVFFLDFQLSFGLTCALALFAHVKQKSPNY